MLRFISSWCLYVRHALELNSVANPCEAVVLSMNYE